MKKQKFILVAALLFPILLIVGCASKPTDEVFENYDSSNFSNSTNIDNQWLPLKPGTQWVYEGYTVEDGEQVPHRVIITVTDLIKVIDGVRSVVTWDQDYSAEQLVEAELAFFAQDDDGTVWRMGEYPEEYENGKFVDAPTWIHGIDDALAGIAMYANPDINSPDYPQGWGPDVDWTDRGRVDQVGQKLCVPSVCYENVLVIAESSKSEPDSYQLKYYAPEVGNISVDWTGEDQTQEKMALVRLVDLDPNEMEEVRAKALGLEAHAYEVSEDVYGNTPPMESP
jgi:hypothetical protein